MPSMTTPTRGQRREGDTRLMREEGKGHQPPPPPCAHQANACPHRRRTLARHESHERGRGHEVGPSSQRRKRTTWGEHPEPADAPATPRCNPLQRLTKERPRASQMTRGWKEEPTRGPSGLREHQLAEACSTSTSSAARGEGGGKEGEARRREVDERKRKRKPTPHQRVVNAMCEVMEREREKDL